MTDVLHSSQTHMGSPTTMNSVKFPAFQPQSASASQASSHIPPSPTSRINSNAKRQFSNQSLSSPTEPHTAFPSYSSTANGDSMETEQHARFAPQGLPQPSHSQIQFPSVSNQSEGVVSARWAPRRGSIGSRGSLHHNRRRSRAKSLSEQTQEAVKVVAPPISVTLVLLCTAWYVSSAVSNNLSKGISQIFDYPVTSTMLQFVYAAMFSSAALIIAHKFNCVAGLFPKNTVSTRGSVGPESWVSRCTAPMAGFQIIGHILSLSATSQIPVSLVHAIKSLSPLLTVGVYTFAFGMRYNISTYLSLIPLTLGVIMACAAEFRARPFAILYAFLSCVVFVSQNIWSKSSLTTGELSTTPSDAKTTTEHSSIANIPQQPRKLDKSTIIFWCAAVGFLGTLPIWSLSDGSKALSHGYSFKNGGTLWQFLFLSTLNGFTHFCQNSSSFMILGGISTVAYSIASSLKRIFVMTAAILWFGQRVTVAQGWGIVITFMGLYIYDRFGSKTNDNNGKSILPR